MLGDSTLRPVDVGFLEKIKGDWIGTIKGNTNVSGGREGDGVYRRMRHIRSIPSFF